MPDAPPGDKRRPRPRRPAGAPHRLSAAEHRRASDWRGARRKLHATGYSIDISSFRRIALPARAAREAATLALSARGAGHAVVSIAFVSAVRIAALNRRAVGHAGPTDIVTLAFRRPVARAPLVADIYIAPDVARRNARRHGAAIQEELARLVIHGVLHATGMRHAEHDDVRRERGAMWRLQERLVARGKGRKLW